MLDKRNRLPDPLPLTKFTKLNESKSIKCNQTKLATSTKVRTNTTRLGCFNVTAKLIV